MPKLKDIFNAPEIEQVRERKEKPIPEPEEVKSEIADSLDAEIEDCFSCIQSSYGASETDAFNEHDRTV